ncbi:MAG: serine/threonine protein kinase [Verrucomicrobiales bacterium]|nr:serine/threonine protein kinase [Verrucomicrobiales bacterium]
MNDKANREVAVFAAARELPPEERAAFLARESGDDLAFRARVDALLRADLEAGKFMEQPPMDPGFRNLHPIGEKPGDRIGRYKLLQQIGEGGAGVVFMAEQEEPVRRRVALKIIKPGMDTKSVIARFEAERQALALMDHPNIAKVFDAGATESGRPFFVMELIRGTKITEYCDENSLTTEERLGLFVQVCQAVQHAHQKGIIHRDLKPSNILVTGTVEGQPLPVVIDFGIAKATTNQRLTDKTLFTAFEMLIGTPAYMSPEQAALSSADVDTRTDIYSLGVLLYEMVTGSTPFDGAALLRSGLDEIRRVIREVEPARPSTRLSTMVAADLTTVAQRRRSEPPHLIRSVRGDLDWIVMKSLDKDRTRRYETANGLALDVKRFLANETVSARPCSKLYKFKKAIQRNKLLSVGIGIIAVLVVASLAMVTASLRNERQARLKAQTEEARSRQATRFLKNMLEGVGPSVARGRNTEMLREILDKTAQQIGEQLGNQPAVEAEMRSLIGRLFLEIGNYEGAEAMARRGLALYRGLAGPASAEAASALNDLGMALWKQRKLAEAEVAYQEALDIRQQRFGRDHADVASTLNNLGAVYRRQKKLRESEDLTRLSLQIRRRLFGNEHLDVADSLRNLCIILAERGQRAEAEDAAREMLAMRRRLLGNDHPLVAGALADLAWVVGDESTEAEALETEAFGIQRKVLGDDHPDVAKSIYLLGERRRRNGDVPEAHAILNAALSIQRKLLGDDHPDVVATLIGLSSVLEKEGDWLEVERVRRQSLELIRQRYGDEDPQTVAETEGLVRALREQKKLAEAERMLSLALTPSLLSKPASVPLLVQRADLRGRQGLWHEAAADVMLCVQHQPGEHYYYHMLAPLLVVTGDLKAYEQLCQQIVATFPHTENPYWAQRMAMDCLLLPASGVDLQRMDRLADIAISRGSGETASLPHFQVSKAMSTYRLARYAEAISWAERALAGSSDYAGAHACAVLAMGNWHLGRPAEARALLAKGEALAPHISPEHGLEKFGSSWTARLMARIALDEAQTLLHSTPPGNNVKRL